MTYFIAYKFLTPFVCIVWAFACAVAGRHIYLRTESRAVEAIATMIGFAGPLVAFGEFLWWALY